MKAYLMTVFVVDHDQIGPQGAVSALETARYPNRCIAPQVRQVQEFDVGEWDDDHPLNQRGVDVEAFLAALPKDGG